MVDGVLMSEIKRITSALLPVSHWYYMHTSYPAQVVWVGHSALYQVYAYIERVYEHLERP